MNVRWSRRALLEVGGLGALGLAASAPAGARPARAKACILVWLNGGPSHVDTFDLKPEAPAEIRGEFAPARTPLDGLRISEHLPRIAALAGRLAFVRSLTSVEGNHDRGSCHYLTGHHPTPAVVHPSAGAVVNRLLGPAEALPLYVTIPTPPEFAGAGFLGAAFGPFSADGPPADAAPRPETERRRAALRDVDALGRRLDENEQTRARDAFVEQAFRLMGSPRAREAFEVEREPEPLRQRYGGHALGRGCLAARRLVEAGARFVTVNDRGWDTHQDNFKRLKEGFPGKLPGLDQAFAALIEDLDARGLLAETLVVLMGEFGRTPRINASAGRDHWPRANSVVLAGAGIRRGVVFGATDAYGELPAADPVEPEDLLATIYALLGIDASRELTAPGGRPLRILARGTPIRGILA